MAAKLLTGKEVVEHVKNDLKERIETLATRGITPGLAVVLVGEDPASQSYVKSKARLSAKLGIFSETLLFPADITQGELNDVVNNLNNDNRFHGVLVQLPLPGHINEDEIINAIRPEKDVDGFHPMSVGNMVLNRNTFISCTPYGIMEMMKYYSVSLQGKHVVIVGRSNIVGKPMLNLLYQKSAQANATVTICHTGTPDIAEFTRQADVVIAAVGVPEMIKGSMLKPGAIVIDVGINRVEDPDTEKGYRIVGDVEFASAETRASAITPVPGGVGLMTVAMLMANTVKAAELSLTRADI